MPTTADYLAAAWQAAPQFGLDPSDISLMSQSENVVCRVALADDQQVALRIHRVGYNSLAELRSEVQWVQSLSDFGIPVPSARTTDEGEHYISVPVAGEQHHVGVVNWVRGEPLGGPTAAAGPDVVAHYAQIGELAARIRAHHARWAPPDSFVRRSWNHDGFVGADPLWGRFWEVDALTPSQQQLFSECRHTLAAELSQLPTTPEQFGLIHSDLHLGNLMADGDAITVIDFDDAGFGWFAHEIAVALHPVLDEPWELDARAALLDGYRKVHELSVDEEARIDTFLTVRCVMLIGWLAARRELPIYEHFNELVAQAEQAAHRYLASA